MTISSQLKKQLQLELTEIDICSSNIQKYIFKLRTANSVEEREILTKAISLEIISIFRSL